MNDIYKLLEKHDVFNAGYTEGYNPHCGYTTFKTQKSALKNSMKNLISSPKFKVSPITSVCVGSSDADLCYYIKYGADIFIVFAEADKDSIRIDWNKVPGDLNTYLANKLHIRADVILEKWDVHTGYALHVFANTLTELGN